MPMEKRYKLNYDPPKVRAVAFRVENGLQLSRTDIDELSMDVFGDGSWDSPSSSSSSTSHFGDGDWTGGSSFSNNSSFGTGSWDN